MGFPSKPLVPLNALLGRNRSLTVSQLIVTYRGGSWRLCSQRMIYKMPYPLVAAQILNGRRRPS